MKRGIPCKDPLEKEKKIRERVEERRLGENGKKKTIKEERRW